MHFSAATVAISLSFVAGVVAQTHSVSVGKGGLNFDPTSLTDVKEGDTIMFTFEAKNHSVVQSTFDSPCAKKADGEDSGFQDASAAPIVWNMTVKDANATWFYCSQTDHCKGGMVFAINPTADKTFEAFQAKAKEGGGANSTDSGTPTNSADPSSNTSTTGGNGNNGAVGLKGAQTFGLLSMAGIALGLVL
ncbi:hypothetical protein AAF712_009314 [Marasmius tenuissimus]|uniref:Phytocyanin domain-containing protein n=1 Tax=Marasmius tenuissimus TaxID=585030 RepID=A0ABR2ZRK4_9AGAR